MPDASGATLPERCRAVESGTATHGRAPDAGAAWNPPSRETKGRAL
jgi:hypothetical protein